MENESKNPTQKWSLRLPFRGQNPLHVPELDLEPTKNPKNKHVERADTQKPCSPRKSHDFQSATAPNTCKETEKAYCNNRGNTTLKGCLNLLKCTNARCIPPQTNRNLDKAAIERIQQIVEKHEIEKNKL